MRWICNTTNYSCDFFILGGAYFGMLGMFLAVPVIAVVRIIVVDYLDYKLELKKEKIEQKYS